MNGKHPTSNGKGSGLLPFAFWILILIALPLGAATRKVQYVDTDVVGGTGDGSSWTNAYATLAAWEGQDTDLVTANQYLDVYFRGNTVDSTVVTIFNWSTSDTCTIHLQMDPNNYHNGIWNDSLYTFTGCPLTFGAAPYVGWVTIDGLQIKGAANTTGINITVVPNTVVKNCLIQDCTAAGGNVCGIMIFAGDSSIVVYNNIIWNCWRGIQLQNAGTVYNNTFIDCQQIGIYLPRTAATNALVKNNLFHGTPSVGNWYTDGSGGTLVTATNWTTDATSPDGAGYQNATVTFVNEGIENYHLDATMDGTLAGTDLSGTFTTDIDGDTRASWYAGADELPSSSTVNQWWWRRRNQ